jgi:ATP-dependent DNA helicase RecQ
VTLDPQLVADAAAFLRDRPIELEPRKQWPGVGSARGRIRPEVRNRTGRALSSYNDGGWGTVVRDAQDRGSGVPDQLVDAAAELVARWQPDPRPGWISYVPSAQHPDLLPDFAARLATRLDIPVLDVIRRVRAGGTQQEMLNSAQQFRNVDGAFEVVGPVPERPVLLVDDIVDSGWTLAVVGAALHDAGSGPVHPLVLARAVT